MRKILQVLLFLCFVSPIAGTSMPAQAMAPYVYQIRAFLLKHKKPTKKRLLLVSPKASANLVDLTTDRKQSNLVRVRAISALVLFKNESVFRVLRSMIFDPLETNKVRGAAMTNIGVFHGHHVVGILRQFILSKTRMFRLSAARGLAKLDTYESCAVLRAALVRETNLDAKMVLDRLYGQCVKGGKK